MHIFHHSDVKKVCFFEKQNHTPPEYLYLLMSVFGVTLIVPIKQSFKGILDKRCLLFFCDHHLYFVLKLYFSKM